MTRRRPPPVPQGDLFGMPRDAARDVTLISIPMREVALGTASAWLLAPLGTGTAAARFAPRALVKRGKPPRDREFTMPRWIALERGWL